MQKTPAEIIAGWPDWKKGILEASAKSTNSKPRPPVPTTNQEPARLTPETLRREEDRIHIRELRCCLSQLVASIGRTREDANVRTRAAWDFCDRLLGESND